MSENGFYDMKQKLLELQNQLIKDADKRQTQGQNIQEFLSEVQNKLNSPEDIMAILLELRQNQQKIMDLLVEINRKMK